MRVVVSWSGGKDSCLACYEAISKGFEVSYLLNFVFKDHSTWITSKLLAPLNLFYKDHSTWALHKIAPELIALQAQAMEIPFVQMETSWDEFENQFKLAIRKIEPADVEGSVWGLESSETLTKDNTLGAQKDWICRVCGELGIKPILPLWGRNQEQNLADFVDKGFEAIFVVVNAKLGEEWLGRKIDHDFLKAMRRLNREKKIHFFSQFGEFHTLVTDGPLFKKRLKVLQSKKVSRNRYLFLDISKAELIEKHDGS